jgi:hypothetical protein
MEEGAKIFSVTLSGGIVGIAVELIVEAGLLHPAVDNKNNITIFRIIIFFIFFSVLFIVCYIYFSIFIS